MAQFKLDKDTAFQIRAERHGGWDQLGKIALLDGARRLDLLSFTGTITSVRFPGPAKDVVLLIEGLSRPPLHPNFRPSRERLTTIAMDSYRLDYEDGADKNFTDLIVYLDILRRPQADSGPHLEVARTAKISFKANGEGELSFNGKSVPCLGNNTVAYVADVTIDPTTDKFISKHSDEYGVDMPWAVTLMWTRGIFIHEGSPTIAENENNMSAGCIHVGPPHAKEFFDWLTEKTRILISFPWKLESLL